MHLVFNTYYCSIFVLVFFTGGLVAARAVKLLDTRNANTKVRDKWWTEIRTEIKLHAKTMNCTTVLGYIETTTIINDVCVLSAYGTAARVGWYKPVIPPNVTNATQPSSPLIKE